MLKKVHTANVVADTPSLRLTGANMKLPDKVLDEVDKREVDKREGLEKMQYTRMGKRSGDFVDETDDDLEDLEQEVMNWGLMGKRGDVVDKLRFTRMGKRGAAKQFTSRMGKRSTNEKLKYTRMGKRDTGAGEDFSG